jgi:hypothetical protein
LSFERDRTDSVPSVPPTPCDVSEAAKLVRTLMRAIGELQLREAERMAYELIRFHWQRDGRRLEAGHAVLAGLATHDLGDALVTCTELLAYYEDELQAPLAHAGAA